MESDELHLIPISALQHFSFCPRQCALIHVEQCFEDNRLTMEGHVVHSRVEEEADTLEGDVKVLRSLPIKSDHLGLIGKADVVEVHSDGTLYPVEYKHGARNEYIHNEIQLTAQALCLEEMFGTVVTLGAIYHFGSRRRREIKIETSLREQTLEIIEKVRAQLINFSVPEPVNDERCKNCSLIELCQPSVISEKFKYKQKFNRILLMDE